MEFKEKLLSKAVELFMRYGIKSVTMDDLAGALGVSKKTIYNEVSNKEELIDQVTMQYLDNEVCSLEEILKNSKDAIDEMLLIGRHVSKKLEIITPVLIYDLKKYYSSRWEQVEKLHADSIYQVISNNIHRGRQEGLYRDDFDMDIISRLYVGKALLLTEEKLFPDSTYDKKVVVKEMIKYHITSIATQKGNERLTHYFNQSNDQ
jgi:TetR/AcrR family transcriptional regulator, cholesterol catabolism regulator